MRASALTAGVLALLLGGAGTGSHACGYDGMAMDLGIAHPASLPVALAIHDAYQARLIGKPVAMPGGFGMRRALIMLEKLRLALAPAAKGESFRLLLVEPGLWAQFNGTGAELRVTPHVAAPAADEPAIITGEGVLLALGQGKLSAEQALQAGLIQIQATPPQRQRLTAGLRQAFALPTPVTLR
jgi:hypothetical protein